MKVLYLSQYVHPFTLTGVGSHIHGIAKNIQKEHSASELVIIGSNKLRKNKLVYYPDNIKVMGFNALIEKIKIPGVGTLIDGGLSFKPFFMMKKENPDIVHLHCFANSWLGVLAVIFCFLFRKKLVYTPHYHDIPHYRFHPLFYLNKLIMKCCNVVIAVTKMEKNKLSKLFNIPLKKIDVVYNGVDEDLLEGEIKYQKRILYVGQGLDKRKGLLKALNLFLELKKEDKLQDFKFHAVGVGVDQQKYFDLIPSQFKDDVKLLGRVSREELVKQYQNCYALILPSDYEAFGIVLAESMVCEKPAISFDVGGVPEAILDNETGFLVRNEIEMKDKLLELINSFELTQSMGKKGKSHVMDNFLWSKSAEKQHEIYCNMSL